MLVLAGGGLSITGVLVVFGALTGRLPAILAAAFKPADLEQGFSISSTAGNNVNPLNPLNLPGLQGTAGAANGGTNATKPGATGIPLHPKNPDGTTSTVTDPLGLLYPSNQ